MQWSMQFGLRNFQCVHHIPKLKSDKDLSSLAPIISNWMQGSSVGSSLQYLVGRLQYWNKHVFDNIYKREHCLSQQLACLENKKVVNPSPHDQDREKQVQMELKDTFWQEEHLRIKKSRSSWVVEGDHNTKFFHLSTLCRRAF